MFIRPSRAVAVAAVFAAGALALPACKKDKPTVQTGEPPPGYGGSKGGPPPGTIPKGNTALLGEANAASRTATQMNLKEIGTAFFNADSALGAFPAGIADGTGKVGLGWRVALLPYLGQDNLYKQFKLDQPWDSEHNKKLIAMMPKVYAPPGVDTEGQTYYRSFFGPGTVMPPPVQKLQAGQVVLGAKLAAIPDGSSNTILVAEAAEPVIWTKPDELPFSPGKPPKLGGGVFSNGFHALMCDGSSRFIPGSIDATNLSNAIQTNDGNPVIFP